MYNILQDEIPQCVDMGTCYSICSLILKFLCCALNRLALSMFFCSLLQEINKMYIKKQHWRLKPRCIQVKIKHLMGSKISQNGRLLVLMVHMHL